MMKSEPRSQYAILYVDDEEKALKYFRECFQDEFIIHIASSAAAGYQTLLDHGPAIGVLVTDQRMPGANGVELMEQARRLNPNLVKILVTAYTDYQTAVDSVNDGGAFRYIHKPWDPDELCAALRHGLDYYAALTEREHLLEEKASTIRNMIMADKVAGMGILAEGLNHHLRNALTVIRPFVEMAPMKMIEELGGSPPKDSGFWGGWQAQAMQQMDRIQNMLEHISHASQARSLPRTDSLHLEATLAEVIATFSDSLIDHGINVSAEMEKDMPPLVVNGERFRQLWRLLFTQSIADLHPGDELRIVASIDHDDAANPQLLVLWQDNGKSEAKGLPTSAFQPFFTRSDRPDEFGVNLMACSVIVHQHGGSMEAHPVKPHGMSLAIRIPLDPARANPNEAGDDFFQRLSDHRHRWRQREQPLAPAM